MNTAAAGVLLPLCLCVLEWLTCVVGVVVCVFLVICFALRDGSRRLRKKCPRSGLLNPNNRFRELFRATDVFLKA